MTEVVLVFFALFLGLTVGFVVGWCYYRDTIEYRKWKELMKKRPTVSSMTAEQMLETEDD